MIIPLNRRDVVNLKLFTRSFPSPFRFTPEKSRQTAPTLILRRTLLHLHKKTRTRRHHFGVRRSPEDAIFEARHTADARAIHSLRARSPNDERGCYHAARRGVQLTEQRLLSDGRERAATRRTPPR